MRWLVRKPDPSNLFLVLPPLVALVYMEINSRVNSDSTLTAENLVLILIVLFFSFGMYYYKNIHVKKNLQEETIFKLEGENNCLRSALEGLPLGVMVVDNSRKLSYINRFFESITGYGKDFYGKDYKTLENRMLPVSDRSNSLIEKVFINGSPVEGKKLTLISNSGRLIPVQAVIVPLKDCDNSIKGVMSLLDFTSQLDLRKLQQKTHFFLDFTASCVLAVDRNFKVTIFNTASEKLIGVKKEEAAGRHITEIFNDYEAENYPLIKTVISGEEFHNYEVTLFLNGQLRTLIFDTARITDEYGETSGAISIFKDISERKRIEEELKKTVLAYSKEKSFMRNVLNNLPVAIITYDSKLFLTYMNRTAETLTGYQSEEFTGPTQVPQLAATPGFPGGLALQLAKDVLKHNRPILDEQRTLTTREGVTIPVSLDLHPLHNALKEQNGVILIGRDLREKRMHEQLTYLSRCILNSLNSAVVSIDADYRVIVFNPNAENLLGLRVEGIAVNTIDDLPGPFFKENRFLQTTLENGRGVQFETSVSLHDEELILLVTSDVVRDGEENVIGAVAIIQDITELRRTQAAVRDRERLSIIGQMAAGMAHEVKNPLTAVRGFTQLLKEKFGNNAILTEYVGIILEEIDRANSVITDFLQLSRPKKPVLEELPVNNLVEEVLAIVCPQAFLLHIKTIFEGTKNLPNCKLDRDQIKQVLLNMAQNAIEAMPDGGVLKVKTGHMPAEKFIFIEITDTGCGIPRDKLEKIGVPFYTSKASGTGLGLSISYAFIGAHGGRVNVESVENKGTTFRILLPS